MAFPVATQIIAPLYPQLHGTDATDIVFWTEAELWRYVADAAKRLVQRYGIRIVRDVTSVTLSSGVASYLTPPRHMSTLHVALNNLALRPTSTTELERKDSQYQTRAATAASPVSWWYEDRNLLNHIGLYPVPGPLDDGLKLEVIFHQYFCGPDLADEVIGSPQYIDTQLWTGDYMAISAMAEAYKREGDFQMPESAQAYGALLGLYEQLAQSYWNTAE